MKIKSINFKIIAAMTSALAVLGALLFLNGLQDKTSAAKEEAPFYSNELGDNLFYVRGYGDLFVNVIRKDDGTSTGPLSFCLNKQKEFPSNDSSIMYESIEDDIWSWELDNTRTPTAEQVEYVQRAEYAYKYIFADRLAEYGLESNDNMSLYHATQIAHWSILEGWTPDKVIIKDNIKDKPQLVALANKIHKLYSDIYDYAVNPENSSYEKGIKVVFHNTNKKADYTYKNDDYITMPNGKGYFRSKLTQAIPNQKAGFYIDGEYAFTYKVTLINAPKGTRIVNENGDVQSVFSTKPGVGLDFYVDTPMESVVGQSGSFQVKVDTTIFRRNAPILWRPVTDTAYQTLLQNASIPDSATGTITLDYKDIGRVAQVKVQKQGEQINSFTTKKTEFGTAYVPQYKVLPLKGTKFTIEIKKETDDSFIDGEDGQTYFDGQNLIKKGNISTDEDGNVEFNRLPLDKNRDTTSFKVIETSATDGYSISPETYKIVQVTKKSGEPVMSNSTTFINDRIKFNFSFRKYGEKRIGSSLKVEEVPLPNVVFGVYTNETIKAADGTVLEKDSLIDTVVSDADGYVKSGDLDLPAGHIYYLKELKTSEEFDLDKDKYYLNTKINFDNSKSDIKSVSLELTDKEGNQVKKVVNHLKTDNLIIKKEVEDVDDDYKTVYRKAQSGDYEFTVYGDKYKEEVIKQVTSSNFDNGVFKVNGLLPGKYFITEDKCPEGQIINDELMEVQISLGGNNTLTVKNKVTKNKLSINKYDVTSDKKAFSGVTFDLKYGEKIVQTKTTDGKGSIIFDNLLFGKEYTIVERVPLGYINEDGNKQTVKIDSDDIVLEVLNKKAEMLGNIAINKIDSKSKKPLENVGFALYREADKKFENALYEDVTDRNGELIFHDIAPDKYIIRETIPLKGYLKSKDTLIDLSNIKDGETISTVIENVMFTADLEVHKIDAIDKTALMDATLGLYQEENDDTPFMTITTNKEGKAVFKNLPYGIFYLGEVEAPGGYLKSDTRKVIDLTDMSVKKVEMNFENIPISGELSLFKRDTDNDKPLANAIFKLYKDNNGHKGELITTLETDKDGKASYSGIKPEKMILEEIKAPLGYKISNPITYVDATSLKNGQTLDVTIYNKRYEEQLIPKGSITVHKIDSETKKELEATIALCDRDGKELRSEVTKEGVAVFEDLPLTYFTIIEKAAPDGYSVNKTIQEVLLSEHDKDINVLIEDEKLEDPSIPDNPKDPEKPEDPDTPNKPVDPDNPEDPDIPEKPGDPDIPDLPDNPVNPDKPKDKILGTMVLNKYDEKTKKGIPGTVFKIYNKDTKEVYSQVITNDKGTAVLQDIEEGSYAAVEVLPREGYQSSNVEYNFDIDINNKDVLVSAYNKQAINKKEEKSYDVKDPVIEIPETGIEGTSYFMILILGTLLSISGLTGFIILKRKRK